MADHNDIYSIVERLRVLEEGLDKNQKSVNQLSATFKPKTVAVLTAKKDPKNPMAGKLVGGCEESEESDEEMLESVTTEDVLEKVKKSFTDYIKNLEDEIKTDSDLKDKKKEDSDIKKKDKKDRDLIAKKVNEDPTESEPTADVPEAPQVNDTYAEADVTTLESDPVKTITNECGDWEVLGNERTGFNIRRGGRTMPSKFKNLDEAEMALEMFAHRMRKHNESQDYIDEA